MAELDNPALNAGPMSEEHRESSTVVRLFKSQTRWLTSFLDRKLRNSEDAEDASQEVFLRLWRQESSGKLREDATSYMFATARTVAVDCQRARQKGNAQNTVSLDEDEGDHEQLDVRQVSSDQAQYWRDGLATFVSSIEELPLQTQQIFVMYHVEGLTHFDIAARLGISERTVERHMVKALEHCKERLKDYL